MLEFNYQINRLTKKIRGGIYNEKHIYEAENGQEAIDIVLTYQPDILLLDVQMPLKNGIDVMAAAKKAGLEPVIIVLSGYDEFKYAQQALKYGAREYLLKPTRAGDILKVVMSLADEYFGKEQEVEYEDAQQMNMQVKSAQAYIAEHYTEDISLTEVAEHVGISAGYMSTLFTQNTGYGFVDYLNHVRIEHACCYLEQHYLKQYEIAYKIGFRDEKYFAKVFRKFMGMSPKEYRTMKR